MPLASAGRLPPAARAARVTVALGVATWTALAVLAPVPVLASAVRGRVPDVAEGTAYLVAPARLIAGRYYQSAPRFADFGLTIDGALTLAATGENNKALEKITEFIDDEGKDQSGRTVNSWTGIGTRFAASGAIGKEALLAEVVGDNPGNFSGHDLIAALNTTVCRRASASASGPCAGPGNYAYATSVFDQALGIVAQLRAGQRASAAAPIAFLEHLRNADGSFPSLIPDSHDQDVDSTAMAVMALALVRGPAARADVTAGVAWIASRQVPSGSFRGAGGLSVNSAGLAIQALSLRAARYRSQIRSALTFLAGEQNPDGGFNANAGQPGSNVRASTQAVSGATGISFGALSRALSQPAAQRSAPSGSGWWLVAGVLFLVAVAIAATALALRSRRPRRPGRPVSGRPTSQPQDRITS
jgi:hypothetical protein